VRQWLPELARMPARSIHRPWDAPDGVRRDAGLRSTEHYPRPIVDHRFARARYLAVASAHFEGTRQRTAAPSIRGERAPEDLSGSSVDRR
jgi:deoxyribodipyrimidine photo-lyase